MPDFNAFKEVDALNNILEISGELSRSQHGELIANRLLDDAQKEFCKLSPEETKATIKAMRTFQDSESYFQVHNDGHDQPIGVNHSKHNNTDKTYLSFDCPFKTKQ